ncbi:Hypothetical protein NTJ_06578 [Nesidiocoris tenuis]|uniref:Uncharacterized protein n=1 Tax=Nesidiocoris tenuis TaxID=355587 RepID=A0ABN7AQP4_9HEMI|nr:Hypothetical protein NTJ_06578 [Nesidiocoris tenuis]
MWSLQGPRVQSEGGIPFFKDGAPSRETWKKETPAGPPFTMNSPGKESPDHQECRRKLKKVIVTMFPQPEKLHDP